MNKIIKINQNILLNIVNFATKKTYNKKVTGKSLLTLSRFKQYNQNYF